MHTLTHKEIAFLLWVTVKFLLSHWIRGYLRSLGLFLQTEKDIIITPLCLLRLCEYTEMVDVQKQEGGRLILH